MIGHDHGSATGDADRPDGDGERGNETATPADGGDRPNADGKANVTSPDAPAASTRRAVLAATAGVVGAGAGCLGGGNRAVRILAAGSLQRALGDGLARITDVPVRVEAYGSTRCARLVASGQRDPDVLALADDDLFESIVGSPWYAVFVSNALVLAYSDDAPAGRRIAGAERWFRPLVDDDVRLGRTDPDLDPLGYRTLFALRLAAAYYDRPDLPARVLDPRGIYPETQLMAQFETGGIDAAVVYESMAVEHGYEYRRLPPQIDLSAPRFAERYGTVSYELPGGTVVRGEPIRYGATLRTRTDRAERVFRRLVDATDRYLDDHGFVLPDGYPHYRGDPPRGLAH